MHGCYSGCDGWPVMQNLYMSTADACDTVTELWWFT